MRNSYKRIDLPNNYAQLLLDKQIAVTLCIEPLQDNLCALLQLYSRGFEYYQSFGSYKYKFFDIKMKEIFKQKENDENKVIKQNQITNNLKEQPKTVILQQRKSVLQKNKYLNDVENETKIKTNAESLQKILLVGQYKLIEVNMKMKHEIDYQNRLLQRKLQARHQKVIKNSLEGNKLKQNSTKTSLVSQSEKKTFVDRLNDHIFEEELLEDDQQQQTRPTTLLL